MRRLENRVAVITAAGSGMGRAGAIRFASEGAHVYVSDINEESAIAVTKEITEAGGSATTSVCDVRELAQIKELIDTVDRDHGVLHVLYNHAGIPGGSGMEVELDEYTHTVEVNMRSAFYATSYALPLIRKADRKGSIIFTASVSGAVGSPFSPLYSMTKGGLVLLMKSLAVRLGPEGIRSNAILPAMINTPMLSQFFGRDNGADIEDLKEAYKANVPLGRVAAPEEVASAAAFLASDDASWVTGVALPVDGGFLAK
ncbi:MAG: putative short-chain type dehydrogenase/reductase [Pseudonocardiales bacterium]|nr:putative short-chain type dehydrogenase/reductase [Pseudonocardiales bacterium]